MGLVSSDRLRLRSGQDRAYLGADLERAEDDGEKQGTAARQRQRERWTVPFSVAPG